MSKQQLQNIAIEYFLWAHEQGEPEFLENCRRLAEKRQEQSDES